MLGDGRASSAPATPTTPKPLPPYLGFMRSTDGGKTWKVVSRLGEADLHQIRRIHDRLYAFDAVLGAILISDDDGKTWEERFTPRQLVLDFVVDPEDPDHLIASTEEQIYRSEDGGEKWRPSRRRAARRGSTGRSPTSLMRADKDGLFQVSTDGGADVGAARADRGRAVQGAGDRRRTRAFVALSDGTILETTDGGQAASRSASGREARPRAISPSSRRSLLGRAARRGALRHEGRRRDDPLHGERRRLAQRRRRHGRRRPTCASSTAARTAGSSRRRSAQPGDRPTRTAAIYRGHAARASGITALRFDVGEAQDKITAQLPLNIIVGRRHRARTRSSPATAPTRSTAARPTTRSAPPAATTSSSATSATTRSRRAPATTSSRPRSAPTPSDAGAGNDDVRVRDGVTRTARSAATGPTASRPTTSTSSTRRARPSTASSAPRRPAARAAGASPAARPRRPTRRPDASAPAARRCSTSAVRAASPCSRRPASRPSSSARGYVTRRRAPPRAAPRPRARSPSAAAAPPDPHLRAAGRAEAVAAPRRRRRRAFATITVVATDTAGNSSATKLPQASRCGAERRQRAGSDGGTARRERPPPADPSGGPLELAAVERRARRPAVRRRSWR